MNYHLSCKYLLVAKNTLYFENIRFHLKPQVNVIQTNRHYIDTDALIEVYIDFSLISPLMLLW